MLINAIVTPILIFVNTQRKRILILGLMIVFTLLVHSYELLFEPIFGHSHFMHVVHARLCYIPIVLGAFWFGLRGGLLAATIISIYSFVYIFLMDIKDSHELINEYMEIVFYFAIAALSGFLLDRDKKIRAREKEAELRLQQTERLSMMGQMAASIAHEIKNPLGSIKGAAQIVGDKSTSEKDRNEFAEIIRKESDRLDKVVRDFLAYSRPAPSSITTLNIDDVLSTAQKHLKYQAEKQGVTINYNPGDELTMRGDPEKLHQLFLNILLNAIQAMTGGGEIEIRSDKVMEKKGGLIRIEISDNGPGIPDDILQKIFDPFFSTKSQGTGLGLATARAIVTEHRGSIEARSRPGEGTTFIITFPSGNRENSNGTA
jgi:two-component system sensor histidine kinase HydH